MQVALDFLESLAEGNDPNEWHVVARRGMPFNAPKYLTKLSSYTEVKDTLFSRLTFELRSGSRLAMRLDADAVYTLFGPHWYAVPCPKIVGCAYSNLFYPEIPFWAEVRMPSRAIRWAKDAFRRHRLRKADGVIVETEDIARRAVEIYGLGPDRVVCVPPRASALVGRHVVHEPTAQKMSRLRTRFNVLMLCDYHPNKRVHIIPEVLFLLKQRGISDVGFITTLSSSKEARAIFDVAKEYGIEELIYNVGPVPQEGCAELYRRANVVLLASRLESVSNTIVEAWVHRVPLLVSDWTWSRSLCGDGAVYFRFDDAADLVEKILSVRENARVTEDAIAGGDANVATLPTAEERRVAICSFIERVVTSKK